MDSIIIYNSIGTVLYENIPVTSSAESVQELMRSDYIQLSWNSATNETIPAGAYIIYGTEHYSLLEPYSPDQKNEREWTYRPQFVSQFFRGSKAPFFMYSTSGGATTKEADWTLTDNPANFMERVRTAFLNELGLNYTYAVDNNLQIASATLQFNCVDIITACNSIANAFETELWLEKYSEADEDGFIGCLHLGKASLGTAKVLEVGNNIKVPSKANNAEFFNRFYVFGSSRNITQDYQGAAVNNVATKRLTLNPTTYPNGYMDFSNEGPVYSKILQFDGVYPSAADLVVMNIRPRTRYALDENTSEKIRIGGTDNEPIYDTYAVWYVQLKRLVNGTYIDFPFNNTTYDKDDNPDGMLLPGLVPSIRFNSGPLAGREFEVIYHEQEKTVQDSADTTPFTILAGDFEIKYQDENGFILPAMTGLVPQTDNLVVLFNVRMPDSYIESAQDRLAVVALEEINKNYLNTTTGEVVDKNEYQAASDPTVFYTNDPGLVLGGKVLYKNGSYQKETRVTALAKRLDQPCYQNIVFGDEIIKGNIEELKEDAVSANKNIDLLAAISKSTNDLTAAYERTHQLILKQLADQGSFWLKYEQTIDGVTHKSVKLNPVYEGVWAEGFGSFGGIGRGGPGGGGSLLDMWVSLKNNDDDYADWLINAHHLPLGNGLSIDPETGLINVSGGAAGGVTSVAGVLPVNGDVQKGTLQEALGIDLLGAIAQSLQAQIDSVSTKNGFDELAATSLFAETAAIQNLYAEILHTGSLSAKNIDLNGLSLTNTNGVLSMNGNALLSALSNEGNNIAITVGGKKLTLEVGYAKKALGDKNGNDIYATYVSGVAIGTDTRKDNVLVSKAGTTTALTIPYATVSPNTRFTYTIRSTTYANAEFPVDWFVPEEYESRKYRLRLNPKYEGLYSDGWLAAGGIGSHSGGGGGGIIDQLYRFSDLGGSFDDAANDAFNAYTVNALYLRIVALESRPAGGVTSVAGMVGDVTTASLASALGISNLNNNLTTISDCLQSLQSQIDAVATRDMYDELTATAFYAEAVSAQDIHASSFYLNGADINSVFASKLTFAANALRLVSKNDTVLTALTGANLVTVLDSNAVNNVKTEVDNANTLYLVGVTSAATTALKRDTLVTVTGGAMSLASLTATGVVSAGSFKLASGEPTLSWDSDNNAWHLSGNFYADGWIAAGGVGSSGSGGTTDLLSVWASLTGNDDDFADWGIHPGHLPSIAIIGNGITGTGAYAYDTTTRLGTATLNLSLSPSGVTAGTYSSVTVDAYGRVVNGTNEDISVYLQSLQSQIDSVASRNNYDELTATSLFADTLAASSAYFDTMEAGSVSVNGITLNGATLANSGGILQWNGSPLFSSLTTSGTTITAIIGGQTRTHTISASDIVNALGATPVNRATADANGNNIASTYKSIASLKSKGTATLPVYFDADGNAQTITSYEGNAATASRLQGTGTYTAWGQTYWQNGVPKSVSGNILLGTNAIIGPSNMPIIKASSLASYFDITIGSDSYTYTEFDTKSVCAKNLKVGNYIKAYPPVTTHALEVSGSSSFNGSTSISGETTILGPLSVSGLSTLSGGLLVSTTPKVYFGDTDKYLELVNIGTNESPVYALHSNVGFYSDDFITAGGVQGGGEAPTDLLSVWSSLIGNDDDYAGWNINPGHLPSIVVGGNGVTGMGLYSYNDTTRTATATLSLSLSPSGVSAGTYRSVTVDTYGRVTDGTNPTTVAGYGLTDVYTKTEVDAKISGIDLSVISEAIISLQSQIDSVASRDAFDELEATVLHADTITCSNAIFEDITGSLNGNATTASYLVGTSYGAGNGLNPVYFSGGRPVASTSTAGSTSVPVFMNGGTLTAITPSLMFSALSSSAATNLSVTIAGQNRTATLYATYDSASENISDKFGIVSDCLRSLQSQVDSVSSRDSFDELNATVLYADVLSVGSDFGIGGNVTIGGTLGVTGATNIYSTLRVSGATTLSSTLEVTGATTVWGRFGVGGSASSPLMFYVNGSAGIQNALTVTGATTLSGATAVNNTLTVGTSTTNRATTLNGTLYVSDNTTVMGRLGVGAAASSPLMFYVSGKSGLDGDTSIGGELTVGTANANKSTTLNGALYVTGATTITNALTVGTSANNYATTLYGSLTVGTSSTNRPALLYGDLTVGQATAVRTTKLYGTLSVSSDTTVSGRLGVGGAASSPLMLYVNGKAGIQDDTAIGGSLTIGSPSANKNALVYGYLYIGSATSYIRYDGTGLYSNVGFASASYITAGGVASSSDIRLKDEIENVCSDRALAVLMQLKPKEWVWNEKNDYFSGKRGAGLVAQDVEDVLPFAVMETGGYKSLNYSVLHAYEIAGLQNHEERIAELEKENKELKEKLEAYAAR